jgi:hypothetical protein
VCSCSVSCTIFKKDAYHSNFAGALGGLSKTYSPDSQYRLTFTIFWSSISSRSRRLVGRSSGTPGISFCQKDAIHMETTNWIECICPGLVQCHWEMHHPLSTARKCSWCSSHTENAQLHAAGRCRPKYAVFAAAEPCPMRSNPLPL